MPSPEKDRELDPKQGVRMVKLSGDPEVAARLSELEKQAQKNGIEETEAHIKMRLGSSFRKAS